MIALLDTNVLISFDEPSESAAGLDDFDEVAVSSLSWAELSKGLHTTPTLAVFRHRAWRLTTLQKTFGGGIPFDDECVHAYGQILTRVTSNGGSARSHTIDRMLAATALAHDMTLVTRDRRLYADVTDLVRIEQR